MLQQTSFDFAVGSAWALFKFVRIAGKMRNEYFGPPRGSRRKLNSGVLPINGRVGRN
jgi:hypothetical protein